MRSMFGDYEVIDSAQRFMVFDVESIGIYGPGFAVGWVVIDRTGEELSNGYYCAPIPSHMAHWDSDNWKWLHENVLPACSTINVQNFEQVRDKFWEVWSNEREKGTFLVADVPWPVESNFLMSCILDHTIERGHIDGGGPYPLLDVASLQYIVEMKNNTFLSRERLPSEMPIHNPLADARQSARLMIEALDIIESLYRYKEWHDNDDIPGDDN